MKILIWMSCCLIPVVINLLFNLCGILLGGIPTMLIYLPAFLLARYLCKKYDERKAEAEAVYKVPNMPIVYTSLHQLISEPDIEKLHYTTLFVEGKLAMDGKNYIIADANPENSDYIKAIFDGTPPTIDNTVHRFKGTLMVENSQIMLQWAKQVF